MAMTYAMAMTMSYEYVVYDYHWLGIFIIIFRYYGPTSDTTVLNAKTKR